MTDLRNPVTDTYGTPTPASAARPGPFTIDRITGQWQSPGGLNHPEQCIIAASVMPGWTPELVGRLYDAWLRADGQTVVVTFADGDITVAPEED